MKRRAAPLVAAIASLAMAAAPLPIPDPANYRPADQDERGLWMQAEDYERGLKTSNFVMRDAQLNAYVRQVFCKTVGQDRCQPVRIYIMRTPYFNASMAPNGVMQLWSGLFLRVRDEAQLAAIIGHEYVHYANRHSLKQFRDLKSKTNAMTWLGFLPYGVGLIAQVGMIGAIFSYSRDMESEADAGSVTLIAHAGYDPRAAASIWTQLRAEMDATALARGTKSRKDKTGGLFASHPPTAERMSELTRLAALEPPSATATGNADAYRAALGPWWPSFIDDQIKLNDFGATELLLTELAAGRWTPDLNYARGELYRSRGRPEDLAAATGFYRQAIADPSAPVEAWRGLGLALLRTGGTSEGRAMLKDYLTRKPGCSDRAMIAMLAGETT